LLSYSQNIEFCRQIYIFRLEFGYKFDDKFYRYQFIYSNLQDSNKGKNGRKICEYRADYFVW
jgi:hypothetical protein